MTGPERRRLRLKDFDYSRIGAYFVTICAHGRTCVFGEIVDDAMQPNRLGRIVVACWIAIPDHFPEAEVDSFALMPNHVHGILTLERAGHARPLPVLIASFKSAVSRQAGRPVWQRSFHDRVLRDDHELPALRRYVSENPLRWAVDRENPRSGGRGKRRPSFQIGRLRRAGHARAINRRFAPRRGVSPPT